MLINNSVVEHVRFISYDGEYPNLCRGTLIIEVDGREYKFSPYKKSADDDSLRSFLVFWRRVRYKLPSIHERMGDKLPLELQMYADEIDRVFNERVSYGCCGGCA